MPTELRPPKRTYSPRNGSWETTEPPEELEMAVPERPKRKGPKPRCEHGYHPETCLACKEELVWNVVSP